MTAEIYADSHLVEVVLDLIDRLLEALREESELLTRTHNTRVADLAAVEERLDGAIS